MDGWELQFRQKMFFAVHDADGNIIYFTFQVSAYQRNEWSYNAKWKAVFCRIVTIFRRKAIFVLPKNRKFCWLSRLPRNPCSLSEENLSLLFLTDLSVFTEILRSTALGRTWSYCNGVKSNVMLEWWCRAVISLMGRTLLRSSWQERSITEEWFTLISSTRIFLASVHRLYTYVQYIHTMVSAKTSTVPTRHSSKRRDSKCVVQVVSD